MHQIQQPGIVNVPNEFEDESWIFLEVIEGKSRGYNKNPRKT